MSEEEKDQRRFHYQMADMWWSLRNLRKRGFTAKTIIDIGAYEGEWTETICSIFSESTILMIEAQPDKELRLKGIADRYSGRVSYMMTVLGAQNLDAVLFHVTAGHSGNSTGSSVFEEQSNVSRTPVRLPMRTLDSVVAEKAIDEVSLLKLDVQGYELEVLRGAEDTLGRVEVILAEVSLLATNKGAPLIDEVIHFMKSHGYVLYDICSFFRRPSDKLLYQMDVIFVRQDSKLVEDRMLVF